jgi:hypothetical protein
MTNITVDIDLRPLAQAIADALLNKVPPAPAEVQAPADPWAAPQAPPGPPVQPPAQVPQAPVQAPQGQPGPYPPPPAQQYAPPAPQAPVPTAPPPIPQAPGTGTVTVQGRNGPTSWTLSPPNGPYCLCGVPAAFVTGKKSDGGTFSAYRCAKGAGNDWKNKCQFNQWI